MVSKFRSRAALQEKGSVQNLLSGMKTLACLFSCTSLNNQTTTFSLTWGIY